MNYVKSCKTHHAVLFVQHGGKIQHIVCFDAKHLNDIFHKTQISACKNRKLMIFHLQNEKKNFPWTQSLLPALMYCSCGRVQMQSGANM